MVYINLNAAIEDTNTVKYTNNGCTRGRGFLILDPQSQMVSKKDSTNQTPVMAATQNKLMMKLESVIKFKKGGVMNHTVFVIY